MTGYNELKNLRLAYLAKQKSEAKERINSLLGSLNDALVENVKKGESKFTLAFSSGTNKGEVVLELQTASETVWSSPVIEKDLMTASELVEHTLQGSGFIKMEGKSDYALTLPDQ